MKLSYTTSFETLYKQEYADGCVGVMTSHVVRRAKSCAATNPQNPREKSWPKYIVKVDGKTHNFFRSDALDSFLKQISIGAQCKVFRNSGRGATIDFNL